MIVISSVVVVVLAVVRDKVDVTDVVVVAVCCGCSCFY